MLQPLRFVGGSSGEASGQQWQRYGVVNDGQPMAPPQPLKRKPGRPRGGAKWRQAAAAVDPGDYHR